MGDLPDGYRYGKRRRVSSLERQCMAVIYWLFASWIRMGGKRGLHEAVASRHSNIAWHKDGGWLWGIILLFSSLRDLDFGGCRSGERRRGLVLRIKAIFKDVSGTERSRRNEWGHTTEVDIESHNNMKIQSQSNDLTFCSSNTRHIKCYPSVSQRHSAGLQNYCRHSHHAS
jgi:hypothetical protein